LLYLGAMGRRLHTTVVALALLATTLPAAAQTKNRVAVGVSVAAKQAVGDEATGTFGPGFTWRFGTSREGWHLKYGLSWYKAEISRTIADEVQAFGRLRVRPVLAGYGYTHVMGKTSVSGNVLGGYSFNSFSVHDTAASALRSSLGTSAIVTDVANSFVLKPEVSVWRNMTEKIGVNFNVGYIVSRPFVTLDAGGVHDRHRVQADALTLSAGIVYSIF
jgi:hypothetical protein